MENKRGGARDNSGRKSKAEEQKLIEKLTPLEHKAFKALDLGLEEGKDWAVKLYFQYMYGMPQQVINQKTELSFPKIDMNEWK